MRAFAQAAAAGITVVEVCPAGSTPAPRRCTLWQTGSHPKQLDKPGALLLPVEGETESQLRNDLMQARAQGCRVKLQAGTEAELALALRLWQAYGGAVTLEHRAPTAALAEEIAHSGMPVVVGVARKRGAESAYSLAARLMKLGAVVALSTDHPTARIRRFLPLCAGLCLRYGVEERGGDGCRYLQCCQRHGSGGWPGQACSGPAGRQWFYWTEARCAWPPQYAIR